VFPASFIEEAVFSPTYIFDIFVKNQLGVAVWFNFSSVLLVFLSVHGPLSCWNCDSLVSFEHRIPDVSSTDLWLFGVFCAFTWILGLIFLFLRRGTLVFLWRFYDLENAFGSLALSPILILQIHEHCSSFY
jgi:hypothetical protein